MCAVVRTTPDLVAVMKAGVPEVLGRRAVYAGYLSIDRLTVRAADGAILTREIEHHGDAAVVLPYDAERRCVLVVRLFRAPVFVQTGANFLEEACAGMIESETAGAAGRREAMEELGVSLNNLEFVARVWSSPGVSAERQSLFLAPYTASDRIGAGGGVAAEHEDITVVERPLRAFAHLIERGGVTDAKLLLLLMALRLKGADLFT